MQQIHQIISDLVLKQFAQGMVGKITASEDVDSEGDAVIRVMVVYDPEKGAFEPRKLLGLTWAVREALEEVKINSFPIFRFVSQKDSKQLTDEAA